MARLALVLLVVTLVICFYPAAVVSVASWIERVCGRFG